MRLTLALLALMLLATPLIAEEAATICDPTAINWVYPGHFDDALKTATDTNRLLMIKCVFFGVDKEGAKCATKGLW